jgi:SpoVK/Ycf46/Vps4 family AAA+-type ATPase
MIIDEADGILSRRQQQQGAAIVVNPCLYAILEATRSGSSHYSLILTTRLPVEDIDPALLDRQADPPQ